MHVRETVEVAGLLCLGARSLLEDCPRISDQALAEYWAASRCRLDEWGRALRVLEDVKPEEAFALVQPIAEEVIVGQVLTRTLAALAIAHDRQHGLDEAGPIARNVVSTNAEGLARARTLLRSHGQDQLDKLKPLTQRVKRWTDLLLGYVAPLCGSPGAENPAGHAIEFAFDPCRVQQFAYDSSLHVSSLNGQSASTLMTASMRAAFEGADTEPANPGLNQRIAGAALGIFGPEAFDSHGLLRTTLLARVERVADDTLGLVEQLFNEPSTAARPAPQPADRWNFS